MRPYRLSKSKIISGLQCPKRLYLEIHQPALREDSAQTEALFAMGHRVGEIAQELVPNGVMISMENWDIKGTLKETRLLLAAPDPPPLFEATFSHNNILVRADILFPENGGYRLVEVKASTSVKDYHLNDCAAQAWVIEGAGFPVNRVELAHVDTSFVYPGGGQYDGLLFHADVTAEVQAIKPHVPEWVAQFQEMLAGEIPAIEVGPQCTDPFECPFIEICWPQEPDYPVGILPRGRSVAEDLQAQGIIDIRDIPESYLENPLHERVREVTTTGQTYIDPAIREYLNSLPYPRFYLDFETIGTAVPIWPGTRPYQTHLPFQWSLHIEREPGMMEHAEFLDLSGDNPMRPLAEDLLDALGDTGPVFVYSHFEKSVLHQIGTFHPDLTDRLEAAIARLEDLLPLMRTHYYHPDMKGSWSIKAVLPTVAPELNYANLEEVQDGGAAQAAYLEACELKEGSERYEALRGSLLKYCELDTLALVKIVWFFTRN
jgi:hypothetical protein